MKCRALENLKGLTSSHFPYFLSSSYSRKNLLRSIVVCCKLSSLLVPFTLTDRTPEVAGRLKKKGEHSLPNPTTKKIKIDHSRGRRWYLVFTARLFSRDVVKNRAIY